jgi:hypothetical protein
MKVLGLKSIVKIGSSKYLVEKIEKKGITLVNKGPTLFALSDILENLKLGTMTVEKV